MTTILPLESFRKNFNYHPWHFWGLASAAHYPLDTNCPDLVYRYGWQANDSAGREDIKTAITAAETKLREWLGYNPLPHYQTVTLPVPRWYDDKLNRLNYADSTGRWLNVKLPEGKVKQVGVETRTLIGAMNLVYSDADGDGLNDTFTGTIATTVTDVSQLEVMFGAADRFDGTPISEAWAVAPLTISLAGGTATIKGKAWQAVRPVLYESGAAIDPSVAGNFATALDVYRHYCDPTGTTQDTAQAVLIWETQPWPWFVSGVGVSTITPNSADPAAVGYALARCGLRDAEHGIISIGEAVYDTTSGQWGAVPMTNYRPPDRVLVRYQAGDDLDSQGHIQAKWVDIWARLAAAELTRRICQCQGASRSIYEQQIDHTFSGDARVEKYTMPQSDNDSPFGFKQGQLYAWRLVRHLRQMTGVIG